MNYTMNINDEGLPEIDYRPLGNFGNCERCADYQPRGPFGYRQSLICLDCANYSGNITHTVKVFNEMLEFERQQNLKKD